MTPDGTGDNPQAGPYQLFMLVLSVYVLLALAAEAFLRLGPETRAILRYADTGICLIFMAEFLFSLVRAKSRIRYFVTWGWIDLISSIPAVGVLRIGRAARVIRIVRLLRGVRSTKAITEYLLTRRAQSAFLAATLIL